jgi:ribulose-5-phosphate 4-epimerase/fuculose-1-phosphate aldolase
VGLEFEQIRTVDRVMPQRRDFGGFGGLCEAGRANYIFAAWEALDFTNIQGDFTVAALNIPSLKDKVSPEEWQLRVDLAACYRLVAAYGWSDLVFTHVSARIPGPEHHFLINPYGLMFDEITASSLVKIDLGCNKLSESAYPVNPAGFTIHSCIHQVRDDAGCVLHTHTRAGIAVSAQKGGVLPLSQQSTFVLASLAYHDYEGVALNEAEKPRLQADLGRANFLMLRNHGLLTVGKTIQDAFLNMYTFENTCRIQMDAQSAAGSGAELNLIPQNVCDANLNIMKVATAGQGAALAWPALLRKLDRMDESYKT